jgi:hypothetical protein
MTARERTLTVHLYLGTCPWGHVPFVLLDVYSKIRSIDFRGMNRWH